MKEPKTEEEFEEALQDLGYEVVNAYGHEDSNPDTDAYRLRNLKNLNSTGLEAEDYPSALSEAWLLVKPKRNL